MLGVSSQRIYSLSRNRSFLLRAATMIVLGSMALAFVIWIIAGKNTTARLLAKAEKDPEAMIVLIREAPVLLLDPTPSLPNPGSEPETDEEKEARRGLQKSRILSTLTASLSRADYPNVDEEIFRHYARAIYGQARSAARAKLETIAETRPQPFVHEMLGNLSERDGIWSEARQHFAAELELRDSYYASSRVIYVTREAEDKSELRRLLDDPNYKNSDPWVRIQAHAFLRDYLAIFSGVLTVSFLGMKPLSLLISLFVAIIWLIVIGQSAGFRNDQRLLYAASVLLGIFSAILTLYVVILQDVVFQTMTQSDDLIGGLIYFIAGVGLREELIKLICFIPLVPWLKKRGNPMEALIAAAFVGLGFALEENLSYYLSSGELTGSMSTVSVGRFLTANFAHLSMTGIIGYAFYKFALHPRRNWEEFLATFLMVVVAHGMYDAVIVVPALAEFSFAYIIVLALLAYRLFEIQDSLQWTGSQQISPLGIFVIGMALLIGVSLNVFCYGLPPYPSYPIFLFSCVSLLPVAFIFINRFRDT